MSDLRNLFATSNNSALREAMRQLGAYYGVKDKNSFVQVLLKGTEHDSSSASQMSADSKEINENLSMLADAIISLQGDGIYSDQLMSVLSDYVDGAKTGVDDHIAKALTDSPKTNPSPISLTLPEAPASNTGYLRGEGIKDMFETNIVPKNWKNTVDNRRRAISVVEIHHPNLNFSNRDTAASSVFLMALPSIEISKAVPYFDMKTITKGDPIQPIEMGKKADNPLAFGNGISIYKFLHGEHVEKGDAVVQQLAKIIPTEFAKAPRNLSGGVGDTSDGTKAAVSVAGMELFTSPQTMVDGTLIHKDLDASSSNYGDGASPEEASRGGNVLDKFRPLMTIKSFNVTVTPATGMLATKSADVKLTLHDKTRMNQIMPFIIPGQLGDVEFLIEWGWSHPEIDANINPYGALINSMRCKEKYGIMNSSYTFTATGEVEISLKLYTKGAANATFELVSNTSSGEHPSDILKKLVIAIRSSMKSLKQHGYTMNADMGAPDVLGKASSVGGLLSLKEEEIDAIRKFLDKRKEASTESAKSTWEGMVNSFDGAFGDEDKVKGGVAKYQEKIQEQWKAMMDNCCALGQSQIDPYLMTKTASVGGSTVVDIDRKTHVSLAKVIATFVARPILETGKFNEVQLVFYPMNEFSMWARDLNTGQYPVNKAELRKFLEYKLNVTPSISIQKFLNMLKKHFVNFVGDDIYGLSSFYSQTTDEGKRELADKWTKDENAKAEFTDLKVKILEECYGGAASEKRFKKPNIQMWVECVGHLDAPDQTILRLHFFDKACTSYGSYADMWSATSASDLGVMGQYKSAKTSLEKMNKNPPKKKDAKWEEKQKDREKRVTNYEKLRNDQLKEFIDKKLLDPFTYVTKDRVTGKNKTVTKYRIKGGPEQLRGILAANMPTLKYGTEYSGILSAQLNTNSNPQMETIHMQRQGASSGPSRSTDLGLPMTVKPVTLSLTTFGCPYINFGQQFFCDFQTNTSIDDIYAVTGVSHSLSPSEFKTSIKLSPLNKLGQFKSMTDSLEDATAVAAATSENM